MVILGCYLIIDYIIVIFSVVMIVANYQKIVTEDSNPRQLIFHSRFVVEDFGIYLNYRNRFTFTLQRDVTPTSRWNGKKRWSPYRCYGFNSIWLKSDLYLRYRIEDLITPDYWSCSMLIILTNQSVTFMWLKAG